MPVLLLTPPATESSEGAAQLASPSFGLPTLFFVFNATSPLESTPPPMMRLDSASMKTAPAGPVLATPPIDTSTPSARAVPP